MSWCHCVYAGTPVGFRAATSSSRCGTVEGVAGAPLPDTAMQVEAARKVAPDGRRSNPAAVQTSVTAGAAGQRHAGVEGDDAVGPGEERVDVELGDFGQIDGEAREPQQEVDDGGAVGG
jgi:hypothetical protein